MRIRHPLEIEDFLTRKRVQIGDLAHIYLGKEDGSFYKDWDSAKLRILLTALWRYQDARGNQTMPLLYQMLNEWREDVLVERAHVPETDAHYKLFKDFQIPIFGLESKHSMGEYDIIATSLSYVPVWWNFPLMLKLSGIPSLRRKRTDEHPLIMVGGSAVYGNFGLVFPVADIIFLGDAEDEEDGGIKAVLSFIMDMRGRVGKEELCLSLQEAFDYVMCPTLYVPHYKNEKFTGWSTTGSSVPVKLRARKCKNLDAAPKYTQPVLSYTDNTMGLGEVEISRGCRGMCAFCGIGWKYRPYRERSTDVMVKAMVENKLNGGAISLCPIATEFAYYSQKRRLISELSNYSRFVDPLSMRIDAFTSDPEFDVFLRKLGMNQLALGVEAPSQRLRNRLMKGISEEEILAACKIAIEAGYARAKFFMIANIDETWEDFEEFLSLLRKVIEMKNRAGSKIELRASWTPLFVEAATPLQWKRPTINDKGLDWKRVYEELKTLGIELKYGVKRKPHFLAISQGMHIGDTRFAEAVVRASESSDRPFYLTFSDDCMKKLDAELAKVGYLWSFMDREKGRDEEFLWDIVDRGVKKTTLLKLWDKISSGEMDDKKVKIVPTMDDCELSKNISEEQEEVGWYLVKYTIPDWAEIVPNQYWFSHVHRAAYKSGFPIAANRVHFFSNRDNGNWYGGVDYFGIGVKRAYTKEEKSRFGLRLYPMSVQDIIYFASRKKVWKSLVSSYMVVTDISEVEWEKYRKKFDEAATVDVRNKETRYFSGAWKNRVNLKSIFYIDVKVNPVDSPKVVLDVWLSHEVGIRFALSGLLPHVSPRRIKGYKIEKTGLHRVKDWVVVESL